MNIKEFSKEIGIATSTISRAITGNGYIDESKRKIILDKMVELGYSPNPQARRLKTGRSHMVLLHNIDKGMLVDYFLSELARGIQYALKNYKYGLLMDTVSDPDDVDGPFYRWVVSKAVDGVILSSTDRLLVDIVRKFASDKTPFVILVDGPIKPMPHAAYVCWDSDNGIREAAKHLVDLGHKRIAYIGGWPTDYSHKVFRDQLESQGLSISDDNIIITGMTQQDGVNALRKLLTLPDPPTAIFARKEAIAIGIMKEARRIGIRIPEDLSVIGHDDLPIAELVDPPLTTVRADCFQMGRIATETLMQILSNPEKSMEPKKVKTELVIRETTARAPVQGLRS